jgi:hypothetical protein
MSTLKHEGKVVQEVRSDWQTQARGTNRQEYEIYIACVTDGGGIDVTTGRPIKTFEEWMNS